MHEMNDASTNEDQRDEQSGSLSGQETSGHDQGGAETQESASSAESDQENAGALADLDLETLDLTVETVEERISPSETNVFDK